MSTPPPRDPRVRAPQSSPHRTYQQIAIQVVDLIRSGAFRAGECLPPERELAHRLGVSRNALREAMIALELVGLVEVRVGAGTFVLPTVERGEPVDIVHIGDRGPGPFELCAARRLIEGDIAAVAAVSRTAHDLEAIRETITGIEEAIDAPYAVKDDWDRLFHLRIAEATGNTVLASVVDGLYRCMQNPMFETLSDHVRLHDPHLTIREHRMIWACLTAGDAEASRAAMEAHMNNVMARLAKDISIAPDPIDKIKRT